jgi:hypothetical protein
VSVQQILAQILRTRIQSLTAMYQGVMPDRATSAFARLAMTSAAA